MNIIETELAIKRIILERMHEFYKHYNVTQQLIMDDIKEKRAINTIINSVLIYFKATNAISSFAIEPRRFFKTINDVNVSYMAYSVPVFKIRFRINVDNVRNIQKINLAKYDDLERILYE